ncbi:7-methylguanosine phosphate-specific 5'-nucleotidase [Nilaparvata lugens]|uniref:7-methylguanosine phosphate-specific 5'-nucleotidase n=1 Tax=Nilaparvata lugens TaxID=108931 RepID=UPI00193DB3E1|nr:7-methylguanosine phosphate-specific 5'-nucleotidase [Nilaparvata lugens]
MGLFSVLDSPNVRCNDKDSVINKIKQLVSGGKDNLQFITDFDRTLTKRSSETSFGILEHHPNFPESVKIETAKLVKKYLPIEFDPKFSVQEKIPLMVEWWMASEQCLKGLVLDYANFEAAVRAANMPFRDECDRMLKVLNEANVPTLIFSAGIGDVIQCAVKLHSFDYSNVHIVSNFIEFDGDVVTGFKGPMIHIFNKNEHAIKGTAYFKDVMFRKNVILMGDSLGDADMAEGIENPGVILKIGFLSSKDPSLFLPQYLSKYDIVLLEDETMHLPLFIIDSIVEQTLP